MVRAAGIFAPVVGHVGDGNFHMLMVIDTNNRLDAGGWGGCKGPVSCPAMAKGNVGGDGKARGCGGQREGRNFHTLVVIDTNNRCWGARGSGEGKGSEAECEQGGGLEG